MRINFVDKVKEKYYQIIFTLFLQEINLLIFVCYQAAKKMDCEVMFYLNLSDLCCKTILLFIFTSFLIKGYIISKRISIFFLVLFVFLNEIYLPFLFYNISQGINQGICSDYTVILLFFIIFGLILNVIYSCIFGSLNYHLIRFKEIYTLLFPYQNDEKIDQDKKECVICVANLFDNGKETIKLKCNHPFHKECILEWFERNKSCPICRREYP